MGEETGNSLTEVLKVLDEGGSQTVTQGADDNGQPHTVALVDVGEGDENLVEHEVVEGSRLTGSP